MHNCILEVLVRSQLSQFDKSAHFRFFCLPVVLSVDTSVNSHFETILKQTEKKVNKVSDNEIYLIDSVCHERDFRAIN